MLKTIKVKLNRDHWHAGEFYEAGKPVPVSDSVHEHLKARGMLADSPKTTKKPGKT